MRAVVRRGYGPPDILELQQRDEPVPTDDQVLVRVHGSSVNQGDWLVLVGKPFAVRLVGGLFRPKHEIIGLDVAGRVHAVGKNVTRFQPGDEVFGEVCRAHAEYVCATEDQLALKPSNLSFEQAAAVPVAGLTALQGMRDSAKVQPGHEVLINGASGGVGTFAVQIAKAFGAEVTGVCSTNNLELVRSIGADHVVDYTRDDFTQATARYDVIFDLVGSASLRACRRALAPGGVYVCSVGRMGWMLKSLLAGLLPGWNVAGLSAQPNAADLATLAELIEAGKVTPVIDRRYELSQVADAMRYQGRGHTRGKSIIAV